MGFYLMVFIFNVKLPVSCQKTYQSNAHSRDRVQKKCILFDKKGHHNVCASEYVCEYLFFFSSHLTHSFV